MRIVLRVAGSILGSPPSVKMVSGYSKAVSRLVSEGNAVAVVVGGGPIVRSYINAARELGLTHAQQDTIGLSISRINARLVAMKLGISDPVPTTINEMVKRLRGRKTEVMGGLKPGMTTDTVAVLVAERWNADLMLKGSDQEGIYTADPRKYRNAKKLSRITPEELGRILGARHVPGIHSIVDPVAAKMLQKSRIKLIVFKGTNPNNVISAAHGKKIGTLVVS